MLSSPVYRRLRAIQEFAEPAVMLSRSEMIDFIKHLFYLKNININDMIIVYYKESIEKNIKPIKIIKQYNYNFNNETSDSENNMEYL
jgi:hypothetical protein